MGGCCSCGGDGVDCPIPLTELPPYPAVVGPLIPPSCDGMLDFRGSFIAEGIPLLIPGVFDMISLDEVPEDDVISDNPC